MSILAFLFEFFQLPGTSLDITVYFKEATIMINLSNVFDMPCAAEKEAPAMLKALSATTVKKLQLKKK